MTKKANLKIIYKKTADLVPYARNARLHDEAQVAALAGSIREFGFTNPVLIDAENSIVAGHGRVLGAQKAGVEIVPCVVLGHLTPAQVKAYRLADNKLAELGGGWDNKMLSLEVEELVKQFDYSPDVLGFTQDEVSELLSMVDFEDYSKSGRLSDNFIAPPFSVFDARSGWWKNRKREWASVGIKSEEGRDDDLIFSSQTMINFKHYHGEKTLKGTSIFDPVLCELLVSWFCASRGKILDPFSGGGGSRRCRGLPR